MTFEPDAFPHPSVTTLYVARPQELPPLTAQAAFAAHQEAAAPGGRGGWWAVETTSARLVLCGTPAPRPTDATWRGRRTCGRLRSRARPRGVPVEVEVSPWSHRRSEVGIRPRGRAVPMRDGPRQRHYFSLAVEAADALARALEDQVQEWMEVQLDRLPWLPDCRAMAP